MKIKAFLAAVVALVPFFVSVPIAGSASVEGVSYTVLTVDQDGNPTSGMVSFPVGSARNEVGQGMLSILPETHNKSVGGGDWVYGWQLINGGTKECFSHYIHRSRAHSASASMGDQHKSATARSGQWAKASVRGGLFSGTCNAYWSNR